MSRRSTLQSRQMLRRSRGTFLLFILLYNLLFNLVISPACAAIWNLAWRISTTSYIISSNLGALFVNPGLLLAILLIMLAYTFWGVFEIAGVVTLLDATWHGRSLRLGRLYVEAWYNVKHIFKIKNWPLMWFATVIIPFTNLFMTGTFIRSLNVPEYIQETINDIPLYHVLFLAVSVLLVLWTIAWFFVFHFFILDRVDLKEAAKRSIALLRHRIIRTTFLVVLQRISITIGLLLLSTLFAGIGMLFYLTCAGFIPNLAYGLYTVAGSIALPIFSSLASCLETLGLYACLTWLYHEYRDHDGQTEAAANSLPEPIRRSNRARKLEQKFHIRYRPLVTIGVIGMCVVLFASSILLSLFRVEDGIPVDGGILSLDPYPAITCHRGYSELAPENTLPAFWLAIESGVADYVELDVQQAADGTVVITHDTNLERCTGIARNVTDLTLQELRELDASKGYHKENAPLYSGTTIPTLEEVLRLCKGRILLNIEIKGDTPELEAETVRLIERYDCVEEVVITSLRYDALEKVKELNPDIRCGYILPMGVGDYYDLPCADFFSVESTFVTKGMVDAIHQRGKQVHVWTVDTRENAERMVRIGVDNIITGSPDMVYGCIHNDSITFRQLLSLVPFPHSEEEMDTAEDA